MTPLRRAATAALCTLAVLVTADFAAWAWTTSRMLDGLAEWQQPQAAAGMRVRSGPPRRAGWPLAAQIVLPEASIGAGAAEWQAGTVRLTIGPAHPQTLMLTVEGPQSVRIAGRTIAVDAQDFAAAVPLTSEDAATITARGVTARLDGATARLAGLAVRLQGLRAELRMDGLALPGPGLAAAGLVDRVMAEGHLSLGVPPVQGARAAVTAWAGAGGQAVLDEATLRWGPLGAVMRGTGGFDGGLQPLARATLHLTGYDAMIDAFVRARALGAASGRAVATVLNLMQTGSGQTGGGQKAVDVPLTLQDGIVAMGAIPLARLPAIPW